RVRLTGTRCIRGRKSKRLTYVLGIADEIVWIAVLETRLRYVSKNHTVPEREIRMVVVRDRGSAARHKHCQDADPANHRGRNSLYASVPKHAFPPQPAPGRRRSSEASEIGSSMAPAFNVSSY